MAKSPVVSGRSTPIEVPRAGILLYCAPTHANGAAVMQNTEQIWRLVDDKREAFEALSDRVWEMPEIAYTEHRSVAEHRAELERQGFRITDNVAEIPTAIMGEAGDGGPVIAILGEYDALPGLSQEAGVAEPRPIPGDGMGHGCGHNLLGSASLLAASAV